MASYYTFTFLLKQKEREKYVEIAELKLMVFTRKKDTSKILLSSLSEIGLTCWDVSSQRTDNTSPSVIKDREESFHNNVRLQEMKVKIFLERKGVACLKATALFETPRVCPFALPLQRMKPPPLPRPPRFNASPRVVNYFEDEPGVF